VVLLHKADPQFHNMSDEVPTDASKFDLGSKQAMVELHRIVRCALGRGLLE
jgi:hypothetical protein